MPYHILLVDDDPYFRSEFQECMEEFNVIGASNAQEALRIFKQPNNIDLVILDEILPGAKGTDLLQDLKAIQPNINTILLTGHSTTDVAIKALRAQATDFIEKPLDDQKIEKIKNIVLSAPGGERDRSLSGVQGKIERARFFAERNFNKKLKLKDVAEEVCLSTKYLSRIFKENTGMSFSEYKLKLRIEQAKKILQQTGDSIEEISYRLGY